MKIQSTSINSIEPKIILSYGHEEENPILRISLRDNTSHELEPFKKTIYFEQSAFMDYYTFRLLYLSNVPFFMISKLVKVGADCLEKILKLYILSYNPKTEIKKLSHNLSKIREVCEESDSFFANPELKIFCDEYSQKMLGFDGHQIFGYSDNSVVESWEVDSLKILNLVDEVFLESLIRLNNNAGFFSDIFSIYANLETAKFKYRPNFEDIRNILFFNNIHIEKIYKDNESKILSNIIPR